MPPRCAVLLPLPPGSEALQEAPEVDGSLVHHRASWRGLSPAPETTQAFMLAQRDGAKGDAVLLGGGGNRVVHRSISVKGSMRGSKLIRTVGLRPPTHRYKRAADTGQRGA